MKIIQFPDNFVKLILEFQDCFTKPSFELFKVVLSAILLGRPKKTLTSGIRLTDIQSHFSNVHRFVGRYKWDLYQLTFHLFRVLDKSLKLSGDLVFALDDTLVPKYGSKIFGRGSHRDYSSKLNTPQFIMGHKWIIIGLLHNCRLFAKWICFPLVARLFIPKNALDDQGNYKSPFEITIEILHQIKSIVKQRFTVVADGLYARKQLLRHCFSEQITFISRLRKDAALFELPGANSFGRPRKYGPRLPNPTELGSDPEGYKKYRLKLYGKLHELWIKRIVAMWRPAGRPIQVLLVHYDNAKEQGNFFCTDIDLSVEKILTYVAARWSIENLFSDLKECLGMKDWQVRIKNSVLRSVPLTCIATSVLMLWSLQEINQRTPEFWDLQPWQTGKSCPSIWDIIYQFKAKCVSANIFEMLRHEGITRQKYRQIEIILRKAA